VFQSVGRGRRGCLTGISAERLCLEKKIRARVDVLGLWETTGYADLTQFGRFGWGFAAIDSPHNRACASTCETVKCQYMRNSSDL